MVDPEESKDEVAILPIARSNHRKGSSNKKFSFSDKMPFFPPVKIGNKVSADALPIVEVNSGSSQGISPNFRNKNENNLGSQIMPPKNHDFKTFKMVIESP
jgi:hypothetical protein